MHVRVFSQFIVAAAPSPAAVAFRPDALHEQSDRVGKALEEIGRIERVGCSAPDAEAFGGEFLLRVTVLEGAEGELEPDGDEHLFKSDEESGQTDGEVFEGCCFGAFEDVGAGQDIE